MSAKRCNFASVKILVFIMAFAVLVCSIVPCSEQMNIANTQGQTKILKICSPQEHNDNDCCSPFCSCNCCCGITFLFTSYKINYPAVVPEQWNIMQLPGKISDASIPIWQPPKFCWFLLVAIETVLKIDWSRIKISCFEESGKRIYIVMHIRYMYGTAFIKNNYKRGAVKIFTGWGQCANQSVPVRQDSGFVRNGWPQ